MQVHILIYTNTQIHKYTNYKLQTTNTKHKTQNTKHKTQNTGVYFGYAMIENDSTVYKMCMSIGWNPYYNNEKKTAETHIMHVFEEDFYGKQMSVVILGHIRPEANFNGLQVHVIL